MKRTLSFVLILLMLLSAAACSVTPPTPDAQESPAPEELPAQAQEDALLATVNGDPIMRSDILPTFNQYKIQFMQYGFDFSDESMLQNLQDMVLGAFVEMELIKQEAARRGITLTEQELSQNEAAIKAEYEQNMQYFNGLAQQEGAENAEERAHALYAQALLEQNFTPEAYESFSRKTMHINTLAQKLMGEVHQEITLSREDAQSAYAADLLEDRARFEADPSLYEAALNDDSALLPLFVPEGYVRVKHILVKNTEEGAEETAEDIINSIHARLRAGEDFDAMMEEFGEDPGMQREPAKTEGYLMSASTNFVEEFKDAALALEKEGDITKPVLSDHGYHIIKLIERVKSRDIPFEEVEENYMKQKLVALQSEHYTALITQLLEGADITKNTDALRATGANE